MQNCRLWLLGKVVCYLLRPIFNCSFFSALDLAQSGRDRLQENETCCHLKIRQTSLTLFIIASLAFNAAKVLGLPHTQGHAQLPLEILQPLQGSNSRASLALSVDSRTLQAV